MSRTIPLDRLRFGHEANPPINARRVGRDDGIAELAASINAHGLITPPKVKEVDGVPYVGIGNRRLAAMRLLAERGDLARDYPVPCDDFDPAVDDPREVALAEQILRAPLHEADQYEEFRLLADAGLSEASIASRFGIEPQRVKRILALGRLSPVILEGWRNGEFNENGRAGDVVRAFTLAPSIEEQERVYAKLIKDRNLHGHAVRMAFGGGDRDAAKHIKIAGLAAYEAAGGRVTRDLFGDEHVIADKDIAQQVAEEAIKAKVAGLKAEGWSWVSFADDLPYSWTYSWSKLKPCDGKATADEKKQIKKLEKAVAKGTDGATDELAALQKAIADRLWTPEHRASAGAVLNVGYHGDVEITRGVVKPEAAKKEKAAAGEKGQKPAPTISNAMHQRLSAQATLAVRAALKEEPRLGLVALLAGFIAHRHLHTDSPVRAYHDGFGKSYESDKESFASAFERLSAMSDAELFSVAAGCAGEAAHLERPHPGRLPFDVNAAPLAAAINANRMTAALREHFDAKDYFGGVAKPFVIQAIREALNEDEARKADKLKKKELVEFALANVVPTGWLPPELRCATYSGPGEIPVPAPSPVRMVRHVADDEIDAEDYAEDLDEVA